MTNREPAEAVWLLAVSRFDAHLVPCHTRTRHTYWDVGIKLVNLRHKVNFSHDFS